MKFRDAVLSLALIVAGLIPVRCAFSQTADSQSPSTTLAAARCQYAPAEKICAEPSHAGNDASGTAQAPQRFPGPPCRPRCQIGPPGSAYPPPFVQRDDGHNAAIGALIGFGVGAAAGAGANTDARGRFAASLLVGSIGALLGAAVGHTIPVFHVHRHHRRDAWPDDGELAIGSGPGHPAFSQQSSTEQTPSVSSTPSRPATPTGSSPVFTLSGDPGTLPPHLINSRGSGGSYQW
jgi:hypothetical protein